MYGFKGAQKVIPKLIINFEFIERFVGLCNA